MGADYVNNLAGVGTEAVRIIGVKMAQDQKKFRRTRRCYYQLLQRLCMVHKLREATGTTRNRLLF